MNKKASIKKIVSFLIFAIAVILLILLLKNKGDVIAVVDSIKGFFG